MEEEFQPLSTYKDRLSVYEFSTKSSNVQIVPLFNQLEQKLALLPKIK